MRVAVFLAASLTLAACSKPAERADSDAPVTEAMMTPAAVADSSAAYALADAKGGAAPQVLAPEGAWSPVGRAFGDVADILAGTIALMVRGMAALGPWALVIGVFFWIFRRRLLAWRERASKPTAPPKQD